MKSIIRIFTLVLITLIVAPVTSMFGASPFMTLGGVTVTSLALGLIPMPSGVAMMALVPDLWTGELVKHFRHTGEFLSRIPKKNEYVKYNSIHLVDIGADPDVLINNTTYPIASSQRNDGDIVLALDKFDTKNTVITDDELNNLPYDKPGSVIESHRMALEEATASKSAHSLAPQAATANTPVVLTSGTSNGETNARKRMTVNDIVKMKRYLDDIKVPTKNRELVLCPAHVEDLLLTSQVFRDQFFKTNSGEILDMFSFKISQFSDNPLFSNATGEKKAYGAAANAADDLTISLAYFTGRTVQTMGTVSLYHAKAKDEPEYRQSKIGFRLYHLCLPKKTTGFGAIVSDVV